MFLKKIVWGGLPQSLVDQLTLGESGVRIGTMPSCVCRGLSLACAALLVLSCRGARGEETWTEVRSPHFRVVTNSMGKDGRIVANAFEQMRQVLAMRLGADHVESGVPLTIVVARDGKTFQELDPRLWKARDGNVAGEFHAGWERQFVILRMDSWVGESQIVAYHEYTHSIMHATMHWLPMWLDEGTAEFYAYTRFQDDHIQVGAPSRRLKQLRERTLIPVSEMLDMTGRSSLFRDDKRTSLFYAEAWGMVHYMTLAPGMRGGGKLAEFTTALESGTPQQKAFQDVFGDMKAFEAAFSRYVQQYAFTVEQFPPDRGIDPKTFQERKLSPAEADYELGCFAIGTHDLVTGRTLVEKSVTLDPQSAAAHEELGYLDFDQGKDEEAEKEWKTAISLDGSRARSLFALTMSGAPLAGQSPDQLRAMQKALQHVVELGPMFAPAYADLALVEWRLGLMEQAEKDAREASTLAPGRAEYYLLIGRISLARNQPDVAATYARYVARNWARTDHNEAVDLLNALPPAARGDGPPLALDVRAGSEVLRGTIVDASCGATPRDPYVLSIKPDTPSDSQTLVFKFVGNVISGFADTLWWGEDHFTLCHHLAGLRALIAYKPQTTELLQLDIRDVLPEGAAATSGAKAPVL